AAAAAAGGAAPAAAAEAYPARTILVIDPFAPGGSSEVQVRVIVQRLSQAWGQAVVVESRPGAGGAIGSQSVARAAPDGYTLLFTNAAIATVPSLAREKPFDPLRDFSPIVLAGKHPFLLVAQPALPDNLKDLLAYAKANPRKLNFSSSGVGAGSHLAMEYFGSMAGIQLTHVPYKGSSPAATAIVSGEVQLATVTANAVLPYLKSGKLRAVGVSTLTRSPLMPEVPTIAEAGIPGFEVVQWSGFLAPAKTPDAIIDMLNREINAVLRLPDIRQRFADLGIEPAGGTPRQFADFLAAEVRKWTKVIQDAGIRAE
ncbi:MAG: tripartite tricarboxylate transporter substrate binding protein, partial [Burkholderiales bacterium]